MFHIQFFSPEPLVSVAILGICTVVKHWLSGFLRGLLVAYFLSTLRYVRQSILPLWKQVFNKFTSVQCKVELQDSVYLTQWKHQSRVCQRQELLQHFMKGL